MHIIYTDPSDQERTIEFDATLEETFGSEVDVTENEVEQGAPTSDNARPKLKEYKAEIVISNYHIVPSTTGMDGVTASMQPLDLGNGQQTNVLQYSSAVNRARNVYEELERISDSVTLIKIVSAFKTYENMVLKAINAARTPDTGNELRAELLFREMRVVSVQSVPQPDIPSARGRRSRGSQNGEADEDAPADSSSALSRLTGLGRRAVL